MNAWLLAWILVAGAAENDGWSVGAALSEDDPSGAVRLVRDAQNEITDYAGNTARPVLTVECDKRRIRAWIDTGLQIDTASELDLYHARASFKVDDGPVHQLLMKRGVEGEELHFRNARRWLKQVRGGDQLTVGFVPFASKPVAVGFDVSDLEGALGFLSLACSI